MFKLGKPFKASIQWMIKQMKYEIVYGPIGTFTELHGKSYKGRRCFRKCGPSTYLTLIKREHDRNTFV